MIRVLHPFWQWSTFMFQKLLLYTFSFWKHVDHTKVGMELSHMKIFHCFYSLHPTFFLYCIYQYLSVSIGIYQYLSVSIGIYWYLSVSIGIYRYLSVSIGIYWYLSVSIRMKKKNTDFNIIIYSHTSRTSKNSCSIVISHPYYTSFTPTFIVVVVTVVTH